jgi:LAO/AO transport system kinase
LVETSNKTPIAELLKRLLDGDTPALARIINHIENNNSEVHFIVKSIHRHTGKAHRVGLTGVPGVGKSTLIDRLISAFRKEGKTIGIIAVDPTSPFSGGALLGDRVRMQQHYLDRGVFIRSMATRGNLGGLPRTIGEVANAIDASGKDIILIETVGVGQSELNIIKNVDTVAVILAPGLGDSIQAMKAGLLEVADIFVINKSDQPGAEELAADITTLVQPLKDKGQWNIPVIVTQAQENHRVDEFTRQIMAHYNYLQDSGSLLERRKQQRRGCFLQTLEARVKSELDDIIREDEWIAGLVEAVAEGKLDTYSAADIVLGCDTLYRNLQVRLTLRNAGHK